MSADADAQPTESDMAIALRFLERVIQPQPAPAGRAFFLQTPNRTECAWCSTVLRDGREPVSHGICEQCRHIHFPKKQKEDAHG